MAARRTRGWSHRVAIRSVLLVVLVVVAGCAETPPGDDGAAFTEPGVHPGLTADVDVHSLALEPVRVTITELGEDGRGVVLDRTYADSVVTIEFDDEDVFRENGAYRVTIRVNGTTRWDRTVRHYEWYELRIENDGNVTVVTHAMA